MAFTFELGLDYKAQKILEFVKPIAAAGNPNFDVCRLTNPQSLASNAILFYRGPGISRVSSSLESSICFVQQIVPEEKCPRNGVLATVENPMATFSKLVWHLLSLEQIDPSTGNKYSKEYQDNTVEIGEGSVIVNGTEIGANVNIGSNASVGVAGLGYISSQGGRIRVPHIGRVRIGRNAVIGSGSVIVRGQFSDTCVGDDCRVGNLVNIGHNCTLERGVVISSSCSLGGGVYIGEGSELGVGVTVAPKVRIGKHVFVGAGSTVVRDAADFERIWGNPAQPIYTSKRHDPN